MSGKRPTAEELAGYRARIGSRALLTSGADLMVGRLFAEIDALRAERDEAVALSRDIIALIEQSSKWTHDSTLWEGDPDLGPLWQAIWNRQR